MRQNKPTRSRPSSNKPSLIVKGPSTRSRHSYDSQPPLGGKKFSADSRTRSESQPYEIKKSPVGKTSPVKKFSVKSAPIMKSADDTESFTSRKPFIDQDRAPDSQPSTPKKPPVEKKAKPPKKLDPDKCSKCFKLHALCICPEIRALETDLHVLILQHPQEPDEDLSSARLAHLSLKNSTLKTGLSWANLAKALGREAQPSKWAVLHLGSGIKGTPTTNNLQFVSKQGGPIDPPKDLEGIVVLDGTWSQSKALWWRNPWLLKLKRSILIPQEKSLYRELRKEPRSECLSTLESIAEALDALGEPDETKVQLLTVFKSLLGKYREVKKLRKTAN